MFSRRQFTGTAVLGAAGATLGVLGASPSTATGTTIDRQSRTEWAKQHFRGFENILMPSFTADMSDLDEEGIRLDVRQSIKHGFFSSMCALETLAPPEKERMVAIAVDEAKGRLSIGSSLLAHAPRGAAEAAAQMEDLHALEQLGSSHVLLNLAHAESEQEMVRLGTEIAGSTNLGVVLWWASHHNYARFNPSGIPVQAFDRLAKLSNIVALKFGSLNPSQVFEMYERYGSDMLIGNLWLDIMPITVKHYGQQWSGATTIEMMQSPDKPYCVDWFNNLMEGRYDNAQEIYWKRVAPAFASMMTFMNRNMPRGSHPWDHLKYFQFATGGNGGRSRPDPDQPDLPPIDPQFTEVVNAQFRDIGVEPTDLPFEAFLAGRVNYRSA